MEAKMDTTTANPAVTREVSQRTIKPAQLADGILSYAEAEILPTLEGWLKIAGGSALVLARLKANDIMPVLLSNPMLAALGVIDSDGGIYIDTAMAALKEAVTKHGNLPLNLGIFGSYDFTSDDLDTLKTHIDAAA